MSLPGMLESVIPFVQPQARDTSVTRPLHGTLDFAILPYSVRAAAGPMPSRAVMCAPLHVMHVPLHAVVLVYRCTVAP